MTRMELVSKIEEAKERLKTAGKYHGRDLRKHINRMERDLHIYDKFHQNAGGTLWQRGE